MERFIKISLLFSVLMSLLAQGGIAQSEGVLYSIDDIEIARHSRRFIVDSSLDSRIVKMNMIGDRVSIYTLLEGRDNVVYKSTKSPYRNVWSRDTVLLHYNNGAKTVSDNVYVTNISDRGGYNNQYIFYGDDTVYYSKVNDVSCYGAISNYNVGKVCGHIMDGNSGKFSLYFCAEVDKFNDSERVASGFIYKISTGDEGENWGSPKLVLRHNNLKFKEFAISQCHISDKRSNYYMLLIPEDDSTPYVSVSEDMGESWSYPRVTSSLLKGFGHKLYQIDNAMIISYKHYMGNSPVPNLVVCRYLISDLVKSRGPKDILQIVTNNVVSLSKEDCEILSKFQDIEMVNYKRKKIFVAITSKWGDDRKVNMRILKYKVKDLATSLEE